MDNRSGGGIARAVHGRVTLTYTLVDQYCTVANTWGVLAREWYVHPSPACQFCLCEWLSVEAMRGGHYCECGSCGILLLIAPDEGQQPRTHQADHRSRLHDLDIS